jgi:ABC-type dipeptide/oligopeptide/nickel transport system permease subunit
LGASPSQADWGLMLAESRAYIAFNPWAALVPAAGIIGFSISFGYIADALTRHLSHDYGGRLESL